MKPINSIALLLILTTALLPVSCDHAPKKSTVFWDTGNATVDSLLTLADYYDYQHTLTGSRKPLDSILITLSKMDESSPASIMAQKWHRQINGGISPFETRHLDSIALACTDTTKSPYLAARIKLELNQNIDDPEQQIREYFKLAEYFSDIRDSLRLVYTLCSLKIAYSHIFDDYSQIEYLREAKKAIPDSLPGIHDFVDLAILAMARTHRSNEYKSLLDSIRLKKQSLREVSEIGTMVYTETYRLTGNPTYMDTATTYYNKIHDKSHINALIYRVYQLRLFDERALTDSARIRSIELETVLKNSDIFNIEIERELIRHYKHIGDNKSVLRLHNKLHADSVAQTAMEKVNTMARIKASQEMSKLKQILHFKDKTIDSNKWLWLFISIIGVVIIGVALLCLHRRKSRRQPAKPKETPDNADREMVAAHLVSASNDTAEKSAALGGFDIAFSRVRPGFTEELLQAHPKLTPYELRLCCLLSIGLDTKEIARILSINPDSVKKSRQRLRAKLNMPSGMTFMEYFRNLPQ